ncbi:MAG TPA: RNA polymerase sigma factor, partial [Polyangia bacterium]
MTRPLRHDQATLEDLLDHAAWMHGLARRLLADFDHADDVVQETWLSALRTPPGRGATLRPWIATVMRNLVRSRIRHDTRARTREAHFETEAVVPSPETSIVERETERRLAALVLGLAEPYRGTILRRYHDGQSAADIARDEGIPEGTVRWRLKHALDELRAQLTDEDALDRKALAALLPLPVPTWSPDFSGALSGLWHWLTQTAVAKAT